MAPVKDGGILSIEVTANFIYNRAVGRSNPCATGGDKSYAIFVE